MVYDVCIETEGPARKIRLDGEMVTIVLHDFPADLRNPIRTYTGGKLQPGFHSSYGCFQGVRAMSFKWFWWSEAPAPPTLSAPTLLAIFPSLKTFVELQDGRPALKLALMSSEPVRLQTPEDFFAPQLKTLEPLMNAFQHYFTSEHDKFTLADNGHTYETGPSNRALKVKFRLLIPADESIKDDVFRALQRRKRTSVFQLTVDLWFKSVLGLTPTEAKTKYNFDLSERHVLEKSEKKLWQRYLEDVGKVEKAKKYGMYENWW